MYVAVRTCIYATVLTHFKATYSRLLYSGLLYSGLMHTERDLYKISYREGWSGSRGV